MSRDAILAEIVEERQQQDKLFTANQDDSKSWNDWIALTARHLGLAANDANHTDLDRWRRQMIRIAACSLAALEAYERSGQKWRALIKTLQLTANEFNEEVLILPYGAEKLETKGSDVPYGVLLSQASRWEKENTVYMVKPEVGKEEV